LGFGEVKGKEKFLKFRLSKNSYFYVLFISSFRKKPLLYLIVFPELYLTWFILSKRGEAPKR